MKKPPLATASAVRTHVLGMCGDGIRRDQFKAVLQRRNRTAIRLRPVFRSRESALKHANAVCDAIIATGKVPETMLERQRREDREAEAIEAKTLPPRSERGKYATSAARGGYGDWNAWGNWPTDL